MKQTMLLSVCTYLVVLVALQVNHSKCDESVPEFFHNNLFDTMDFRHEISRRLVKTPVDFLTVNDKLDELPYHLRSLSDILHESRADTKCLRQLYGLSAALAKREMWALKLVDAWGKIPAGVLYGNAYEFGNFDECVKTEQNLSTAGVLQGKYCMANLNIKSATETPSPTGQLGLKFGICVPKVCNADEVNAVLQLIINNYYNSSVIGLNVKETTCHVNEKSPFSTLDWVAISILSFIALLVVLSSVYDFVATTKGTTVKPLLAAFSITKNLAQVFEIRPKTQGVITCLDGIRSMSIIWVVFGHCYIFTAMSPNINMIKLFDWLKTPYSMFLISGTISVDSFFFLSGLLLSYIVFKKMERSGGKLNVPLMYLLRILRLTPVLAIAMLFHMSLQHHLGNGPLSNVSKIASSICDDNWWATLIYVQNYATSGQICMGHSWYLAVDTQLYFISPLILFAIWRWRKKALAGLALLGLLCWACAFTTIFVNDIIIMNDPTGLGGNELMEAVYYYTHTRSPPWVIGVIFGYYLRSISARRVVLSKAKVLFGWIISLAIIFTVIFVLYPHAHDGTPVTPAAGAAYWSLSRIAWPLALCWIVFACVNGYGGPVEQFLSCTFWQPLSKLSYSLYIWHMVIQLTNVGLIKTNTYFSDYGTMLRFWGDFGISILVSLLMYISIEAPISTVASILFTEKKPKAKPSDSNDLSNGISQQNLTTHVK